MDLETMPRRGRRTAALAAVVLAAVVTVAGCDGGGKGSADSARPSAPASPTASDSVSGSPGAPSASGTPSGTAPGTSGGPAQPPTGAPTPASPPGQPSGAATPPANGIAPGEPNPAGTGAGTAVRPPVAYRADGNKLTVYFFGGVCTTYALKADESQAGTVAVEVVPGPPTVQPGHVCTALAKRQAVSADLRSPLTGRTVVDRTSGQEVPLEGDPHIGPDPVAPDGPAK
ncbi:hypothetical protein ACGF07_08875 [Kitasatospora sp. NPDC048194]|uniref:hypothetical protein n=1 Tax=Kitasatospora sp. NPDC048194 TaxID=3364045 RepID=UPI0037109615